NHNSISLVLPDAKKAYSLSSYIKLEMRYPEGVDGVAILNNFIQYAIVNERKQIAADLSVIVKNRLNELSGKLAAARSSYETEKEAKIALLRESDNLRRAQLQDELKALRTQLKTQRDNRMAQLTEAIGIAKSLGIQRPTTPSSLGESERSTGSATMRTEVNNQQYPLYFMGVDALEAEKSTLKLRKSDDFTAERVAQIAKELQLLESNREVEVLKERKNEDLFLAGVEPLRAEMTRLSSLSIEMSRLKLVAIDKLALEPLGPQDPKKAFLIILGLLVGLVVGLACALLRYSHKRRSASGSGVPLEAPQSVIPGDGIRSVSQRR
ncbi:MAG: chain-length determining protein, partial [Pseudomonas sp.]|nr:chain-length determining protein [Pseudomonas sp.]